MADITGTWPREQPRTGESVAEVKVWTHFSESLPHGWTAWHSLKLRTADGWEGEGDFIVAIPGRGFMILEVKGGRIEARDGIWYQNGHQMKRPPRDQAFGFAKLLKKRLMQNGCQAPYGIATVFPDTAFDQAPTEDDLRDTVFGAHDLPHLSDILSRTLDRLLPFRGETPQGDWIGALHSMWGETWIPQIDLGTRLRMNEDQRIRLDRVQAELLDQTEKTRLALIYGLAGSGKTTLAIEKARHARSEGRKVTVLCFTEALAASLRASLSRHDIAVDTVRMHAVNLLRRAGRPTNPAQGPEFWDDVSQKAAELALPPPGERPDLVIIDEAQDLADGDWELVERLSADADGDPRVWAFCDMTQRYWPERELPKWLLKGWVYDLETVYRCPPAVMALARAVVGEIPEGDGSVPLPSEALSTPLPDRKIPDEDTAQIRQGVEDGVIRLALAPNPPAIRQAVETEITKLLKENIAVSDIAVLSLAGQSADGSITRSKMLAGRAVLPADHEAAGSRLVADTFLRFKGLERPAVIVTDLHLRVDRMLATRLFIAITRAQDCLRIVVTPADLDKVPVLRMLCRGK